MIQRLRDWLFPACLVLLASACITPSLPVPPPDPGLLAFHLDSTSGTATFHGEPTSDWPNAKVSIFDERTGRGVITTAADDGSVAETAPFAGADGDRITIVYELPAQSAGRCLVLHEGTSSDANTCSE